MSTPSHLVSLIVCFMSPIGCGFNVECWKLVNASCVWQFIAFSHTHTLTWCKQKANVSDKMRVSQCNFYIRMVLIKRLPFFSTDSCKLNFWSLFSRSSSFSLSLWVSLSIYWPSIFFLNIHCIHSLNHLINLNVWSALFIANIFHLIVFLVMCLRFFFHRKPKSRPMWPLPDWIC